MKNEPASAKQNTYRVFFTGNLIPGYDIRTSALKLKEFGLKAEIIRKLLTSKNIFIKKDLPNREIADKLVEKLLKCGLDCYTQSEFPEAPKEPEKVTEAHPFTGSNADSSTISIPSREHYDEKNKILFNSNKVRAIVGWVFVLIFTIVSTFIIVSISLAIEEKVGVTPSTRKLNSFLMLLLVVPFWFSGAEVGRFCHKILSQRLAQKETAMFSIIPILFGIIQIILLFISYDKITKYAIMEFFQLAIFTYYFSKVLIVGADKVPRFGL